MNPEIMPGTKLSILSGLCLALLGTAPAMAHDAGDDSGLPVCLEGNFMLADAMNAPFSNIPGPGRVLEMNIFTGERGITVDVPFTAANANTPICPPGMACPGPWKPTGVLSGGENGHAFLTSAAQHAIGEFHRDGTPIRTLHYDYPDKDGNPIPQQEGPSTFGNVPRPLGTQFLPNGLMVQNVCDANFFNASNSDPIQAGEPDPAGDGNSSNLYFPPVYSTPERAANSRILIIDPTTLEVVDEFNQPAEGELGHDLWGCMAGLVSGDGVLWASLFHGAAVLKIDWRDGVDYVPGKLRNDDKDNDGASDGSAFKYNKNRNSARVVEVIDLLEDGDPGTPPVPADDPMRRDALRAISLDSSGALYATFRKRSKPCLRGELAAEGCHPGVFRQHISVVPFGEDHPTRTIALDPGVAVIAGNRINRMSGVACDNINPVDPSTGKRPDPDACDVETLYVAASVMNPGCEKQSGPGVNPCFVPGGGVAEYLIDPAAADATDGTCSGDPLGDNSGCAQPVAVFHFKDEVTGEIENLDPRMLMPIHEPFMQ